MAKLNDPPAPAVESIEALKRRFIRQNRELARVNSNQSQRIRNLETEISRLLAENIAIREQAINSAADAERYRASNRADAALIDLKERFSVKLKDLNALVEQLGAFPRNKTSRSGTRRKSGITKANSPDDEEGRSKQTSSGLNIEREPQEGKLPAILEDKYYPRRTLETAEIRHLIDEANNDKDDTESPDLGPPPVAHFGFNEPITFDSAKSPKRVSGGIIPDDEETTVLSTTLETRRKRRTSSLLQDMPVESDETPDGVESIDQQPLLRAGAKRKLDASLLEENHKSTSPKDEFVYHLKGSNAANRSKPSRFTRPLNRPQTQETAPGVESPRKILEPSRRVLAPKSVNSPSKRKLVSGLEKGNIDANGIGIDVNKARELNSRVSRQHHPSTNLPDKVQNDLNESSHLPETPGIPLSDLLSPASAPTGVSAKSAGLKTSEVAITNSVEDVLNGSIGRGSRRARAAVSYAEPNLRDKMRRPDKKLVGAVEGLSKRESCPRDMSVEAFEDEAQQINIQAGKGANAASGRGQTGANQDRWTSLTTLHGSVDVKEEAASPLRDKETRIATSGMSERRHKRTFPDVKGTKIKVEDPIDDGELGKAVERLSIFDHPSSSPLNDSQARIPPPPQPSQPSTTLSLRAPRTSHKDVDPNTAAASAAIPLDTTTRSRRHSIQVKSGLNGQQSTNTNVRTDRVHALTRPSSAMSIREVGSKQEEESSSTTKLKRSSSVQGLTHHHQSRNQQRPSRVSSVSSSLNGTASTAPGEKENEIANKATTMSMRRRSMMV